MPTDKLLTNDRRSHTQTHTHTRDANKIQAVAHQFDAQRLQQSFHWEHRELSHDNNNTTDQSDHCQSTANEWQTVRYNGKQSLWWTYDILYVANTTNSIRVYAI